MSSPVQPPLRVETVDGTTSGRPITTIKVTNGDLSISGSTATIDTSGSGGGSGTVTSIVFSSPLTGGTITTTGTVGIPEADGSTDGYLSSTAYNTFDGKQDAITLTTTGSSGVATFTAGTLNIPNYTNSATIGGSIANSQVAYGSGANTIQGSANLTFDGTNLSVAGYVKSGTGVYDTDGATDLTLQTNSGTDTGKIVIFDGAGQDIEITPNGAGVINLDGLKWPSADGSANQVLQTDGAGTLSFTDASGGVTYPLTATDGSASAPSYSFASDTDTGIYRSGSDEVNISLGNARLFDFQKSGTSAKLQFRGSAPIIECDDGGADLSLRSGGATYGEVLIQNENSDIEITPAGTGLVKISNVYTLPSSDGTANQVLQTDGAGTLSFATVSGGSTSPGGSDTYVQFNDSSSFGGSDRFKFDPDVGGSGNAGMGIRNNSASFTSNGFVIYAEGNLFTSGQVFGNEFLCGSSSSSDVGFGPQTDQNTGIAFSAADQVDIVTGGAYNISFGANKEILLGGTAAGTSGQVLTSGGSGAAVSWADAGGTSDKPNSLAAGLNNVESELLGVGYNAPADGTPSAIQWANSLSRIRPHVMLQAGTLGKGYMWFSAAPSGVATQDFQIGLWNAGTDNKIGTLKATCDISIANGGSAGIQSANWTAEAGEDLDITLGGVYWVGFYGTYGSSSEAASVYFLQQAGISLFPARQSLDSTSATKNLTRVYASGSPSTIGDSPSPTDGDTQTNAVWPYMWYDLT